MDLSRLAKALDQARSPSGGRLIQACHIGTDAAAQLARFARENLGSSCFILSDENTRAAAGDTVHAALGAVGKRLSERMYGSAPLDATDVLGNEVAKTAQDSDFLVAIGSGALCDLAKYAGDQLKKPVLLFATAASMNGYTSGIVALKSNGLKGTSPCRPATAVFADPGLVAKAPRAMAAAGVADYLSKCSASADWRAAHFLRGDHFDESALQFYEGVLDGILEGAERVGHGEPEAVADVLEALMLSGLSMLIAGSSSPASGGEHLISHYLDMKSALYGTPHDLHGAQVGVATIYCLDLWEQVLSLDPMEINPHALAHNHLSFEEIEALMRHEWGSVADVVLDQWRAKELKRPELEAELRRVRDHHAMLVQQVRTELLSAVEVATTIYAAGGPTSARELAASLEDYSNAMRFGRFIRNRFTILDLAAELGLTS